MKLFALISLSLILGCVGCNFISTTDRVNYTIIMSDDWQIGEERACFYKANDFIVDCGLGYPNSSKRNFEVLIPKRVRYSTKTALSRDINSFWYNKVPIYCLRNDTNKLFADSATFICK
jgi:hypothetical protein